MMRPLLPGPPPKKPQSEAVESTITKRRRPATSVASACEGCRQRKSRCDGARPQCSACLKRDSACQYQTKPGETVHQASKRKYGELEQKSNVYQELFTLLATKSHHEASEVLGRIRRGDSAEAILRSVQDANLLLQLHVKPDIRYQYTYPYSKEMPAFLTQDGNPYFDSWLYRYSSFAENLQNDEALSVKESIIYQVPYHAAEIVDSRLDAIKAKMWTLIIDDDALLRRLLQIYFLSEYAYFPAFQKDYFLEDMASGGKRYCSALLVNAILASACHGYSKAANRAEFWNPWTLGYQFLAEARRLWELEVGNAQLTTIQAAIVLSVVYGANGSDEIGRSYLSSAVSAARSLQLFSQVKQVVDNAERNARAITAWSLFGLQAVHSFHVFKEPLLPMPPDITLPDNTTVGSFNYYGEFWLLYPASKRPVPVSYGNTFKAMAEFRVIMNDIAVAFFSKAERAPSALIGIIQMFCVRLDFWYRNLPLDLTARNICFPWQLKLHMHYFNVGIYLLETLGIASTRALCDMSVQKALDDAKIRLETLVRLYYLRHGFESYDIVMVNMLSFLGFIHIKTIRDAKPTEIESRRSTLVLIAQGLQDQGQNCYLASLVFRVMKGKMKPEDRLLLKHITNISNQDEDTKPIEDHVHSSWPLDVECIDVDADKQRLDYLVKKANELHV